MTVASSHAPAAEVRLPLRHARRSAHLRRAQRNSWLQRSSWLHDTGTAYRSAWASLAEPGRVELSPTRPLTIFDRRAYTHGSASEPWVRGQREAANTTARGFTLVRAAPLLLC